MQIYEITKTEYKVSDFLEWQRNGLLDLAPVFQRRNIWRPGAKSFLVDTVARGLPTPIIFLRDRVDLDSLRSTREVVDGQQRLRTLIGYIEPGALPDFSSERDQFTVQRNHNSELARKTFGELSSDIQHQLLNYSFSTHVMPSSIEDRDVLRIFQRLNSTGTKLNHQELRNARYFGEFKTTMYELALEQLEQWRDWGVFSGDEIARMKEVELTSDIVVALLSGFGAKSQKRINEAYAEFDESFPKAKQAEQRFRLLMNSIDDLMGSDIAETVFSREIWFAVLAVYLHGRLFGESEMTGRVKPDRGALSKRLERGLLSVSHRIETDTDLPADVLDAIRGASSDKKSRLARLRFVEETV